MKQPNDANLIIQHWECWACGVVIPVQMERGNGGLSRTWNIRCPICDKASTTASSPTEPVVLGIPAEGLKQ